MISDARVRALARQDGVTAGLAEKHYMSQLMRETLRSSVPVDPAAEGFKVFGATLVGNVPKCIPTDLVADRD